MPQYLLSLHRVAGEVREPSRTLPRATLLGMFLILAVYLAVNAGFFHAGPSPRDVPHATFYREVLATWSV